MIFTEIKPLIYTNFIFRWGSLSLWWHGHIIKLRWQIDLKEFFPDTWLVIRSAFSANVALIFLFFGWTKSVTLAGIIIIANNCYFHYFWVKQSGRPVGCYQYSICLFIIFVRHCDTQLKGRKAWNWNYFQIKENVCTAYICPAALHDTYVGSPLTLKKTNLSLEWCQNLTLCWKCVLTTSIFLECKFSLWLYLWVIFCIHKNYIKPDILRLTPFSHQLTFFV